MIQTLASSGKHCLSTVHIKYEHILPHQATVSDNLMVQITELVSDYQCNPKQSYSILIPLTLIELERYISV